MNSLLVDPAKRRYDAMIGVGGIGSGMFFLLNGDQTLGREESRSGRILDKDDYCKLHIISHYVKVLLGPDFHVVPVGSVGHDDTGRKLLGEMQKTGLSLAFVRTDPTRHTLFSFCFLYPDRSGGNMTTDDSACSAVDAAQVSLSETEFSRFAGRGVALAAPEVPLGARTRLLELATRYGFFRVASFTSEEMPVAAGTGLLRQVDLLCINLGEAAGLLKEAAPDNPRTTVDEAVRALTSCNPSIRIAITDGKRGSYVWDGAAVCYQPALQVAVVSTAGAGDAFTSGLIAGTVAGLPLGESQQLATLAGACSVTSPHTINKELDRPALSGLARACRLELSRNVLHLLEHQQ